MPWSILWYFPSIHWCAVYSAGQYWILARANTGPLSTPYTRKGKQLPQAVPDIDQSLSPRDSNHQLVSSIDQGIPTSTVMGVSRHRSAASLSSYNQPTEAEKLKNAALLDLDLPKKRLRERDEEDEDAEEIDQILSQSTAGTASELKSLEKTTVMKGTFNKCKIENHFLITVVKK